ncbi:PucR family transcriptional regulator [Leifsonia sp. YAF41]|uniref:PucR family transcriptional regulator n=1 Tax=Leifsonia sp. YAF41 TaxID=3233086 RepID=UPI003F99D749
MFDSVQELVDRLAISLSRSVEVDDASFGLLACSAHFGDLDDARVAMLVDREATGPRLAYLQEQRLSSNHVPVVVNAHQSIGFVFDRLCVVLRSRYEVLGYAWITLRTPLDPSELELVEDFTQTLSRILHNMAQSIEAVNAEIETELLTLLSPEQSARAAAARELGDLGMFVRSSQFVALCLSLPVEGTQWTGPPPREMIFRALWRAISTPMIDAYTFGVSSPDTFILIGYRNEPPKDALQAIGDAIVREILALSSAGEIGAEVPVVGIGAPVSELAAAWKSFDQASVAVRVGRQSDESVVFWSDHPVPAAIAVMLAEPAQPHLLPETLRALAESPPDVIELLDGYFRHGGNVAQLADEILVHRATVYYRLRRMAETTGLNLDDGDSRFVIQAWLQQRRLTRQ